MTYPHTRLSKWRRRRYPGRRNRPLHRVDGIGRPIVDRTPRPIYLHIAGRGGGTSPPKRYRTWSATPTPTTALVAMALTSDRADMLARLRSATEPDAVLAAAQALKAFASAIGTIGAGCGPCPPLTVRPTSLPSSTEHAIASRGGRLPGRHRDLPAQVPRARRHHRGADASGQHDGRDRVRPPPTSQGSARLTSAPAVLL